MSESYKTRQDVATEQPEQSERQKALQHLIEMGAIERIGDTTLYHGRSGDGKRLMERFLVKKRQGCDWRDC